MKVCCSPPGRYTTHTTGSKIFSLRNNRSGSTDVSPFRPVQHARVSSGLSSRDLSRRPFQGNTRPLPFTRVSSRPHGGTHSHPLNQLVAVPLKRRIFPIETSAGRTESYRTGSLLSISVGERLPCRVSTPLLQIRKTNETDRLGRTAFTYAMGSLVADHTDVVVDFFFSGKSGRYFAFVFTNIVAYATIVIRRSRPSAGP